MSHQRVRRNGSPTPATSLGGGGAAGGGAGASSRLQPMRATVPFQLKQHQQQHGSPTRTGGGVSTPGGGLPRAAPASRSISPTRAAPTGGGSGGRGGPAMTTQTPVGGGSSAAASAAAAAASSRGSPTRTGGARGSPPRPHHLPPPPPPPPPTSGCGPSPCSSPVPPLPEGSAAAAGRVRHRRHSPEQGKSSPERKSPSSPTCKGERSCPVLLPPPRTCCPPGRYRRVRVREVCARGRYLRAAWRRAARPLPGGGEVGRHSVTQTAKGSSRAAGLGGAVSRRALRGGRAGIGGALRPAVCLRARRAPRGTRWRQGLCAGLCPF